MENDHETVLAKLSFARASLRLSGTKWINPMGELAKSDGGTWPMLRIGNSA
jgi:hypothetical protein